MITLKFILRINIPNLFNKNWCHTDRIFIFTDQKFKPIIELQL